MSTQYTDSHAVPRKGDYVEVTLSPPDHMQYDGLSFYDRFMTFRAYWAGRLLKHLDGCNDYIFTIEQSQNAQRYHLHGILQITSPQRFLHSWRSISLGPVRGKKFHQEVVSACYKIKDRKHLEERIGYLSKDVDTFHQEDLDPYFTKKKGALNNYVKTP